QPAGLQPCVERVYQRIRCTLEQDSWRSEVPTSTAVHQGLYSLCTKGVHRGKASRAVLPAQHQKVRKCTYSCSCMPATGLGQQQQPHHFCGNNANAVTFVSPGSMMASLMRRSPIRCQALADTVMAQRGLSMTSREL
ncbi:unnamed protein product, partial [Ectocarpus sp. 8 AP-2014]